MARRLIPQEYLSIPLAQNIAWLDEYRLADPKITTAMYQRLEMFFAYIKFTTKMFNTFNEQDVVNFIDFYRKYGAQPNTLNSTISYINGFRNYLVYNYPEDFQKEFLNNLSDIFSREKTVKKGHALNLAQLSLVRQFISDKPKYRYVFEMLFQTDMKKQDIKFCRLEYADEDNMCFVSDDGKTHIHYTQKIQDLLHEYAERKEQLITTHNVVLEYLSKITEHLRQEGFYQYEKDLNFYDMKATREKFFIVCPNCKQRLESTSSNWVLAKAEADVEFHLVCKYCKGEPMFYENTD
ncbi:MAG: hypothetical protein RR347_05335 [Anaerovoracaceae bacterium]